jgi:hypothetical protein
MQQQAPLVSSRRWALWQAVTELLWRDRPDRYLRVRYEDFVRQPQRTVQRIAALVDEVPAELPFSSSSTVRMQPHSVSGIRTGSPPGAWRCAPTTSGST